MSKRPLSARERAARQAASMLPGAAGGRSSLVKPVPQRQDASVPARSSGSARFVGARLYLSANQSIPNNVNTLVDLDTAAYDTLEMFDGSTPRLTVPAGYDDGFWHCLGLVTHAARAGGVRYADIWHNGAQDLSISNVHDSSLHWGILVSSIIEAAPGDYFELKAKQNSGSANNINGTAGSVWLIAHFLGS